MANQQGIAMKPKDFRKFSAAAKTLTPHKGQVLKVSRWGFASGLQRYRCGACRVTFNALAETPLAGFAAQDKVHGVRRRVSCRH